MPVAVLVIMLVAAGCHAVFPLGQPGPGGDASDTGTPDLATWETVVPPRDLGDRDGPQPSPDVGPDLRPPDLGTPDAQTGGKHVWSKRFGNTSSGSYGYALAERPGGGGVGVGVYEGSLSLGGAPISSKGSYDVFVGSWSQSGSHQWSKGIGDTGEDRGYGVAVDKSGNIYVTGSFAGTITFGSISHTAKMDDLFLVSYDANGNYRWSRAYGGDGVDIANAVDVDGAGNVVVAGQMEKLVTVEGTNLQGKGLADVLVFSLTSTGGKRWARSFGSPDKDQAWGVAADASGQVTISGDIRGQINMDGHTLQSKGQTDAFVAGLAGATGKVGWVRQAGSTMSDHAIGVRADSAGNVHVTGAFSGSFSLGGPTLYAQGSTDAFVAKLDSKGAHLWSRALGGTGGAQGWGIDVDAAGNVYVVGWHEGLQFEGKPHPTAGLSDVFVLSLTPLGKTRWLATAGGTNGDFGYGVAASGAGVTVLGSFQQTVDFGGGPLSATSQLDLFLWQLTP